jgi:hypothetical protein
MLHSDEGEGRLVAGTRQKSTRAAETTRSGRLEITIWLESVRKRCLRGTAVALYVPASRRAQVVDEAPALLV